MIVLAFNYHLSIITIMGKSDNVLYINSPGGMVTAGMAIYDTMQYIKCDVSTICIGLAASMGAFLLAGGTKGKRFALPNSEIMIHQPSGGAKGQATEIQIAAENILKTKKVIKVMQELIYATKRFERLDKKELKLVDKSSDENDE